MEWRMAAQASISSADLHIAGPNFDSLCRVIGRSTSIPASAIAWAEVAWLILCSCFLPLLFAPHAARRSRMTERSILGACHFYFRSPWPIGRALRENSDVNSKSSSSSNTRLPPFQRDMDSAWTSREMANGRIATRRAIRIMVGVCTL